LFGSICVTMPVPPTWYRPPGTSSACMLLARLIPTLRLRARVHGFERSMLDHELYEQGSLVRVRCMRGTLFALPLDLLPIAWAATRRLVLNMSTSYLASQGLDPKSYELWANRIEALLRTQALLAAQVRSALGAGQQIRLPRCSTRCATRVGCCAIGPLPDAPASSAARMVAIYSASSAGP
jgi:Winged helix DNA-binding domain